MELSDYSPPISPSLREQEDALQKGLGRACMWANAGALADQSLLAACLEDQRFDQQCEDSRSDWLWNIVTTVGSQARFRDELLRALKDLPDHRSAWQLCQLGGHYAEEGDEGFRMRLYEIVEQKPLEDSPGLGEDEIIRLDGAEAVLFAAGIRGARLEVLGWDWHDSVLIDRAVEALGDDTVMGILASSSEPSVRRFYDGWKEHSDRATQSGQSWQDRMQAVSVQDIIEAAHGKERCYWFSGWGRFAAETDLQRIFNELWRAENPEVITRLLRVFLRRDLPEFDSRLIQLCRHENEDVQHWAVKALAQNAHPAVRQFALQQLAVRVNGPVIALFEKNYEMGDEQRILEAIDLPEDPCLLHWMLMDVIRVLECNPGADSSHLALLAYFTTPCQNCRLDAARLLHEENAAPEWLIDECRFDAEERTRELLDGRTDDQPNAD